jgi:hypothetical protein
MFIVVNANTLNRLIAAIERQTAAIESQTTAVIADVQAVSALALSLNSLVSVLTHIETDLNPKPVKLIMLFDGKDLQGMPIQLTDSGAGSSTIVTPAETDAAGNPVTVDPTKMTYGVSDPTAFTVTANNTTSPVSGTDGAGNPVTIPPGGCQYKAIGTAGHTGSFQATSQDTANSLNAQDTITVVPGKATALTMNFSPAS